MPPAPPLPSATLILLRDGAAGLEVLMLKRHEAAVFSGALVFPGGRVDSADGADARVTAIRECYEEVHILLARRAGEASILTADALHAIDAGHAPHFADLVASGRVALAADTLVPFSRWITPERSPKRFDTMFYVARSPADQVERPDGREAVAAAWLTPAAFLAEADAGRERLVFATRMNLLRLAKYPDTAAVLAAAAATAARIAPLCPDIYSAPGGLRIRIPPGQGLAMGFDDCDIPTADRDVPPP
jgi:8-oxo-dGTP pyrophosphatase MutT (NUDIX family)